MSNDLISLETRSLVESTYTDDDFNDLIDGNTFMPIIKLMTSQAEKCKTGEFDVNCYALISGSSFKNIGKTIDVAVLAWRPKAVDNSGEQSITVFDRNSDKFKEIRDAVNSTPSGVTPKHMCGVEFLLYIPSYQTYATLYLYSKTAKSRAHSLRNNIGGMVTLGSALTPSKKFPPGWYAIEVIPCSDNTDLPNDNDAVIRNFILPANLSKEELD